MVLYIVLYWSTLCFPYQLNCPNSWNPNIASSSCKTGSFSRTAVNFGAGCETVVSNIVMAVTVLLSLLLLSKLLYYTPMAILASIILSALPGLIDVSEALRIWRVDKLDFLACIGAFLGVLFGSVEIGLLAAVVFNPNFSNMIKQLNSWKKLYIVMSANLSNIIIHGPRRA